MSDPDVQDIPIGWGFSARYTYPDWHRVTMAFRFRNRELFEHTLDADAEVEQHTLDLGFAVVVLVVESDLGAGTVGWRMGIARGRWLGGQGGMGRHVRSATILRFDPCIGRIGGETDVHPPAVDLEDYGAACRAHGTGPPDYGKSRNSTGFPLRLHIDDSVERHIDDVGWRVKRRMFPHRPPFVFNAVACVGDFDRDGPQKYTNPDSPWFNVFLGYYQLDCRKQLWGRPFGFESASLAASQPCIDDLVRLGKADWNYFSAWDCGVPEDVVDRYCGHDIDPSDVVDHGLVVIGGGRWRHLELLDLTVASAYIAPPPAQQPVENNAICSLFRDSYGYAVPVDGYDESFIPATLDSFQYMAYHETGDVGDEWYHTLIFGGTVHHDADRPLLDAQKVADRLVIAEHYAAFGFPIDD
jgi:hypothetical protein